MNLKELRIKLKKEFAESAIETTDVDFIIAEVLEIKRNDVIFVEEISDCEADKIIEYSKLRLRNVPVDKIFKKAYFYGLEFYVDENVLSPRPESENLVELAIKHIEKNNYKTLLDLCCGSGCLGIAIKRNSQVEIDSVDVSEVALKITEKNMKKNSVNLNLIKSNMFENVKKKYDIIISNPPYISSQEILKLDKEVKCHDPILALDGGEDGLVFYREIHEKVKEHLNENGVLILEIGEDQRRDVINIFSDMNLIDALKDYSGNDRVLSFKFK